MNDMNPPPKVLQSFIAGQWIGERAGSPITSAINGKTVAHTHEEALDFEAAVRAARTQGVPGLLRLDFQQRAALLKALGKYLMEHKEALYDLSYFTGATRTDGWVDIEGGIGTLFAYASMGSNELPSSNVLHEGPVAALGKGGQFVGTHILAPREGIAVQVNAFNFPVWGVLEKFAPSFLAGMPSIVKPATQTSYLSATLVELIHQSGLLPEGALQLVIGPTGDLLDRLLETDVIGFTGSAETARKLRLNDNVVRRGVAFNAEADSLNSAILGADVATNSREFDLFLAEVVREMTVKAGQKCTAIRRIMVPRSRTDEVAERLKERLEAVVVGDPAVKGVTMGALASLAQKRDVLARLDELACDTSMVTGPLAHRLVGDGVERGAFMAPTLLLCARPGDCESVHTLEAFGPVSTLMPYDDDDEVIALARRGQGSLVASLFTADPLRAARLVPRLAGLHGRVLVVDEAASGESTGHGSPLPLLKHGGPGRAGGGEELGGLRAVKHYLQRCAVQGSPTMLSAITGEYVRGAVRKESDLHPFRRCFEDLEIGMALTTHRRTVTEADIVNFGGISGDYFYMHFDEIAARESTFGRRIAHGYFVLSAAAGLFVWPAVGPVLANYGLDTLRFVKPVGIGDTIQARLTCKRKVDRQKTDERGIGQGVVAWDVEVVNQTDELVASYDILTLVAKRG